MSYEHRSAAEVDHETERRQPLFNLEHMEPNEVSALYTALEMARDAKVMSSDPERDDDDPEVATYGHLKEVMIQELQAMAGTSDKALDVYAHLIASESPSTQIAGIDMAGELLHRYRDSPQERQQLIDSWASLFDVDQDDEVRGAAEHAMVRVVYGADWLDDEVKRDLEHRLPVDEY